MQMGLRTKKIARTILKTTSKSSMLENGTGKKGVNTKDEKEIFTEYKPA